MEFLYDFGENWKFQILLEEIKEGSKKPGHPKVIDEYGEPPEQYPDWKNDEFDYY